MEAVVCISRSMVMTDIFVVWKHFEMIMLESTVSFAHCWSKRLYLWKGVGWYVY